MYMEFETKGKATDLKQHMPLMLRAVSVWNPKFGHRHHTTSTPQKLVLHCAGTISVASDLHVFFV
jgi:hypothetical protein